LNSFILLIKRNGKPDAMTNKQASERVASKQASEQAVVEEDDVLAQASMCLEMG